MPQDTVPLTDIKEMLTVSGEQSNFFISLCNFNIGAESYKAQKIFFNGGRKNSCGVSVRLRECYCMTVCHFLLSSGDR